MTNEFNATVYIQHNMNDRFPKIQHVMIFHNQINNNLISRK
jgi:hypothetical protein